MKDNSEDQNISGNEDFTQNRSIESDQENFVQGENALKGLIPQNSEEHNPFDENDENEDDLDESDNESEDEIDQNNNDEFEESDSENENKAEQSDIPLEFPDRGSYHNYIDPSGKNFDS